MSITLRAEGQEFVLRPLTEDEFISFQDKRQESLLNRTKSFLDDGDEEILAAVISPSKEEARAFFETYGNFGSQLAQLLLEEAGDQLPEEDLSFREETEYKTKYKGQAIRFFWIKKDGTKETVLFKRFPRADLKILKREMAGKNFLSTRSIVDRAKMYSLEKEKTDAIAKEQPLFYPSIAWMLYQATSANIEIDLKKA